MQTDRFGSTTEHQRLYGSQAIVDGEIFGYTLDKDSCTATNMSATSDPDTMYFHQAMREPDAEHFLNAAKDEFQQLLDDGMIEIVRREDVPAGHRLFSAVWAMKRKRRVRTRAVYKYKARLNFDGSQQRPGDYDQTYAPVAGWESI